MKSLNKCLFFTVIILIIVSAPLSAQDEIIQNVRVAVFPLWFNEEDETYGPVLSGVVQSTIQWVLRLLEGYVLVETEEYPLGQNDIGAYGRKHNLDNIIYGRVDYEDGAYSISLLLYNCEKDRIDVIKQQAVTSALQIFNLADSLSISLLEQFIGRKLEFGSLAFYPQGDGPGEYEIFINGISFGSNVASIDTFLTGSYTISVEQVNNSDRIEVFDSNINVLKDEIQNVDFPMYRYGYLTLTKTGNVKDYTLTQNGKEITPDYKKKTPIPVGDYTYELIEMFRKTTPYSVQKDTVTISEGEETKLNIGLVPLGPGIKFLPQGAQGRYIVNINGRDYKENISSIDILPAAFLEVKITQIFPGKEEVVYHKMFDTGTKNQLPLKFPLYNNTAELKPKKLSPVHLSLEAQTLAGSFFSAGLHADFFNRYLNASLLAGMAARDGKFVLTGEFKVNGVFFAPKEFSPYAGAALIFGTDFEKVTLRIGPQIGLSWNIRRSILSEVYVENGVFYDFTQEGGNPLFQYMFAVGCRLF